MVLSGCTVKHEYDYRGHDVEQELLHSSIASRIISLTYYTLLLVYYACNSATPTHHVPCARVHGNYIWMWRDTDRRNKESILASYQSNASGSRVHTISEARNSEYSEINDALYT